MPKLRTLSGDDLLRIPVDYVSTTAELPSDPQLHDFRGSLRDADATRRYGHQWVTSQSSVAICVPSVIIPVEYNVLAQSHARGIFRRCCGRRQSPSNSIRGSSGIRVRSFDSLLNSYCMTFDELEREYVTLRQQADAVRSYL